MTLQTGKNIAVAYKVEPSFATLPGATGAKIFRINAGGGLQLAKANVMPNEVRRDGQTPIGRHGSRSVTGQYAADASIGTFDELLEAALRGTWEAELVITEADAGLTSITTTANTIVASAGSWITAGLRKGDVIRLTNHATAANNGRNLRIVELTASTITVAETLTEDAVADSAFTITRPKKVIMGATPVRRSFTFEEVLQDLDASERFKGCRLGSLQVQMQPDGMAILTFGIVGQDMDVLEGAESPYFTDPTESTTVGLVAVDSAIRLGSTDVADLTGVDFTINLNAAGVPVIGSVVTPDVFDNQAVVSGTITGLRKDMERVKSFLDEDELSLHLLLVEPESEPKDFLAFHLPLIKLGTVTKTPGQDNGMVESIPFTAGKPLSGTGVDLSMVKIQTSAAA